MTLGAYSVAKEAFSELIPQFVAKWQAETGESIVFRESYEASGTQARAIVGGFEADIAVLAMESDIDKISKAGLITSDWRQLNPHGGMITRSVVALGTRAGNPKNIQDWPDLMRDDVKVLYPNPKTSGGAQWVINAIYGAGLKQAEQKFGTKDDAFAKAYVEDVHRRVESLDKSARASMAAFEYGVGDVIVTYENELKSRLLKGKDYEVVLPRSTILIENPAAVIDTNADEHGVRDIAEAFIAYLHSEEAQRVFASQGFRAADAAISESFAAQYPVPEDLFTIEYLGGWKQVREQLYSPRGTWYEILAGI